MLSPGVYSYADDSKRKYEVYVSNICIYNTFGSSYSIDALNAMLSTKAKEIFQEPLVLAYIDGKWNYMGPFLRLQVVLYFCFLLMVSIYSTSQIEYLPLAIINALGKYQAILKKRDDTLIVI